MTLPSPIDRTQISGMGGEHEDWHDEVHTASNLVTTMIFSGTGTPEANVVAPVGAIFLRTDGAAETTLYSKETGAGDTGWSAMAGV